MIYVLISIYLFFCISRYDIVRKTRNKNVNYRLILIALIAVAGFRWRVGADQPAAMETFYTLPSLDKLFKDTYCSDHLQLGGKPLYILLLSAVKTMGGRFYVVQLIQAAFVNVLFFRYFMKHSPYIFTCVFLYFWYMYTWLTMEEMKAAFSIAICLFANDYVIEGKWVKAYFLYIISFFFHPSAALLLLTPCFLWLRLNKTGMVFFIVCFILGFFIQYFVGEYLDMLEAMGDDAMAHKIDAYGNSDKFMNQGSGIMFSIVRIYMFILYSLGCLFYIRHKNNAALLKLEPFLMLGIACYILQANVQVFYRYTHFYAFYCIIFFSQVFIDLIRKSGRRLSFSLAFSRALLSFLPLIMSIFLLFYLRSVRYYPYSSIFDMKTYEARENLYIVADRPSPNKKFY